MSIKLLYRKFLSAKLYYRSQKQGSAHTKAKRKGILTRFLRLVVPLVSLIDKLGGSLELTVIFLPNQKSKLIRDLESYQS